MRLNQHTSHTNNLNVILYMHRIIICAQLTHKITSMINDHIMHLISNAKSMKLMCSELVFISNLDLSMLGIQFVSDHYLKAALLFG